MQSGLAATSDRTASAPPAPHRTHVTGWHHLLDQPSPIGGHPHSERILHSGTQFVYAPGVHRIIRVGWTVAAALMPAVCSASSGAVLVTNGAGATDSENTGHLGAAVQTHDAGAMTNPRGASVEWHRSTTSAVSAFVPATLTTASAVRALSLDEARAGAPVRLRAVVTSARHGAATDFTIQDDTGAVWVPATQTPVGFAVGQEVELTGRTDGGAFAPFVRATDIRVLGSGRLPEAIPSSFEELLSGRLDRRRVEVGGVVRGQRVNPEAGLNWLVLELATGGRRLTVNVTHEIVGHPELVDARVRVRGVCALDPGERQAAFLPVVDAHSLEDVSVTRPAHPRPFEMPTRTLDRLLQFSPDAEIGHRVHARGTVTLILDRGASFFLQDETRGIQVFPREYADLRVGESLEVVGFPEPGQYSPVLRDADWRPAGQEPPAEPLQISAEEATGHDGRLVRIRGTMRETSISGDDRIIGIVSGPTSFVARLRGGGQGPPPGGSGKGAEVDVTGVCAVDIGSWEWFVTNRRPRGFQLLLRETADVAVLRTAPWWTPARLSAALGTVSAALAMGLLVLVLHSRRHARENALAREMARQRFTAVLEERNRIAREIHDTLAQDLAAISVHLEVMGNPPDARSGDANTHLETAKTLAREGLQQARRSVWNMRAQILETSDLAGALAILGKQMTERSATIFRARAEGTSRRLPVEVENNLLRAGQEAITNAIRHSGAKNIGLEVRFKDDAVTVSVRDDGCGFDPTAIGRGDPGGQHLGLMGMRERMISIGGRLWIKSAPGAGTIIEAEVSHV